MKEYNVFLRDIKVGVLKINEEGKYFYKVDKEGLLKAEKLGIPIFYQLKESSKDFGEPISIFYDRISNCERFEVSEDISYPGDDIRLVLIKK